MIGLLLLAGSAVILIVGAELFADNAAGAGHRLGISALAVAVLLAGAEPEEMVTAVIAALSGRPELAAGDAIGANVTMFTLALGVAALARPLPFGTRVRQYAVGSAIAGGLAVLALADGQVSRPEGGLLLAAYALLVGGVWWRERRPPVIGELGETLAAEAAEEAQGDERRPALLPLGLAIAGIGIMLAGGWLAVEGATGLVAELGVRDSTIGLTLLALATTAELFALAWSAARRDISELAVAAVVGSAAYNATVSLGAAALAVPLATTGILPAAVGAALIPLLAIGLGWRGRLTRAAGLLMMVVYAAYVALVFGQTTIFITA